MAKIKFVQFPKAAQLRIKYGLRRADMARQAMVSSSVIARAEAGQPVTAKSAKAIFDVLAKLDRKLKVDHELIRCEPQGSFRVITAIATLGLSAVFQREETGVLDSFDSLTMPLPLRISLGTAGAVDVAELFCELSALYRMVGGSGLNFYFEDTKEAKRVAV